MSGRVPTAKYIRLPTRDLYGRCSISNLSDGGDVLSDRRSLSPGSISVVTGCESFWPNWVIIRLMRAVWERETVRWSWFQCIAIPTKWDITKVRNYPFFSHILFEGLILLLWWCNGEEVVNMYSSNNSSRGSWSKIDARFCTKGTEAPRQHCLIHRFIPNLSSLLHAIEPPP